MDAICLKCQEPWEIYYLGHEALFDPPGEHAPQEFKDAHEKISQMGDDHLAQGWPAPDHYKLGGDALTKAVMRGDGCPSCWHDPSRIRDDEDERQEAFAHNLFDSGWDGDPAELF